MGSVLMSAQARTCSVRELTLRALLLRGLLVGGRRRVRTTFIAICPVRPLVTAGFLLARTSFGGLGRGLLFCAAMLTCMQARVQALV